MRGGRHCLDRIREDVQERVALRVDLNASVRAKSTAQETTVFRQRVDVAGLAEFLDQPRRTLDP